MGNVNALSLAPAPARAARRAAVTRMPLREALELGPDGWDALCERAHLSSPFMTWAWHRAWADTAPPPEVAEAEVVLLHGLDGALQALLPLRQWRMPFHRVPLRAATWAIGDIGCPDDLDVLAVPDADLAPL